MRTKSTNASRWWVDPTGSDWLRQDPDDRFRRLLWSITGREGLVEVAPPIPLQCRYLDTHAEVVAGRVPNGLASEDYAAEFRRQIEAATLLRVGIQYVIERRPTGPKLVGVCRSVRFLPPRDGGEITRIPKVQVGDLIRRYVKDVFLPGAPVELPRRFGAEKLAQLRRVRDVCEAAPARRQAAAVARVELSHHTGARINRLAAARQLIWEARQAGLLPPAGTVPPRDVSVGGSDSPESGA